MGVSSFRIVMIDTSDVLHSVYENIGTCYVVLREHTLIRVDLFEVQKREQRSTVVANKWNILILSVHGM